VVTSARSHRGFSLLEMVVLLAVVTSFVAFLAPSVAGLVAADSQRSTEQQVEQVWRAISGDPSEGDFGYLGDMGLLPATLSNLAERDSQTAWHTSDGAVEHVGRIGTGWRGPYLRDFFSTADLLSDAWGRPLTFANGQVTSAGPDGNAATPADNIVFPLIAPPTTGTVFISILVNRIPNPLGATATLYTNVNGEQVASVTKKNLPTDSTFDGFFFDNVPPGIAALRVQHTAPNGSNVCITVTRFVPISVHAGAQVVRDIRMLSSVDVKITENTCTIPN
jgi:type II secretory pathway pseudopilin PulG